MKFVLLFLACKSGDTFAIWWAHKSLIKVFIQFIKFGKFNSANRNMCVSMYMPMWRSSSSSSSWFYSAVMARTLVFRLDNKADFMLDSWFWIMRRRGWEWKCFQIDLDLKLQSSTTASPLTMLRKIVNWKFCVSNQLCLFVDLNMLSWIASNNWMCQNKRHFNVIFMHRFA